MLKRNLLVASLFAIATFVGLGLSAFATDDPKAQAAVVASAEALDTALAEKVETLLRTDIGLTGGGNGKHMVYLSGVTDHHVQSEAMLDHIVALVEAKAAELEAAEGQ